MLDTNIVSYLLTRTDTALETKIKTLSLNHLICISSITEAEIYYGLEKSQHTKTIRMLFESFLMQATVFPWDTNAARSYSFIRNSIEKKGVALSNMDLLIASHSHSLKGILITSDKAFVHLKKIESLNFQIDYCQNKTS